MGASCSCAYNAPGGVTEPKHDPKAGGEPGEIRFAPSMRSMMADPTAVAPDAVDVMFDGFASADAKRVSFDADMDSSPPSGKEASLEDPPPQDMGSGEGRHDSGDRRGSDDEGGPTGRGSLATHFSARSGANLQSRTTRFATQAVNEVLMFGAHWFGARRFDHLEEPIEISVRRASRASTASHASGLTMASRASSVVHPDTRTIIRENFRRRTTIAATQRASVYRAGGSRTTSARPSTATTHSAQAATPDASGFTNIAGEHGESQLQVPRASAHSAHSSRRHKDRDHHPLSIQNQVGEESLVRGGYDLSVPHHLESSFASYLPAQRAFVLALSGITEIPKEDVTVELRSTGFSNASGGGDKVEAIVVSFTLLVAGDDHGQQAMALFSKMQKEGTPTEVLKEFARILPLEIAAEKGGEDLSSAVNEAKMVQPSTNLIRRMTRRSTATPRLEVERLMWQSRPYFVIGQCLLAYGLCVASRMAGERDDAVSEGTEGLEVFVAGKTLMRLHDDCLDQRMQVWRWLTYQFSHQGQVHILSNALLLFMAGVPLEGFHGNLRIFLMFNAGVAGGACAFSIWDSHYVVSGMSAGCYAMLAVHLAELVITWKQTIYRKCKLAVLMCLHSFDVLAFYMNGGGESDSSVSHSAHLGGYLAGLLMGVLMVRNLKVKRLDRVVQVVSALAIVTLLILWLLWLLEWPPRSLRESVQWCWARQANSYEEFGDGDWHCVRCATQGCIDSWEEKARLHLVSIVACESKLGWAFSE